MSMYINVSCQVVIPPWPFCDRNGNSWEWWLRGRVQDYQSRGWWFNPTCHPFETEAISFTSHCLCLSEETLKAGGPYLVSMPGEVKDPTQRVNV